MEYIWIWTHWESGSDEEGGGRREGVEERRGTYIERQKRNTSPM
jgi:hypothetical protein